jgi:Zn-finger nucleic acid-binding protein
VVTNKIRELDKIILRSGKLINKRTIDQPTRGGNKRDAPNRERKRTRKRKKKKTDYIYIYIYIYI